MRTRAGSVAKDDLSISVDSSLLACSCRDGLCCAYIQPGTGMSFGAALVTHLNSSFLSLIIMRSKIRRTITAILNDSQNYYRLQKLVGNK
jgi:hypothetical protein